MAKSTTRTPLPSGAKSRPTLGAATAKFEAGRAAEMADFQKKLAKGTATIKKARSALK